MNFNEVYEHYNINPAFDELINDAERNLSDSFNKLEEISEFNQLNTI